MRDWEEVNEIADQIIRLVQGWQEAEIRVLRADEVGEDAVPLERARDAAINRLRNAVDRL